VPVPGDSALSVPINSIDPNPLQPRRIFEAERLAELAQSIRANGIIQPLVVRKVGERYQLVAGERRWRAAKLAEVEQVRFVIRDIPIIGCSKSLLLKHPTRGPEPIETATPWADAATGLSADEIGRRTGKDRPPSPISPDCSNSRRTFNSLWPNAASRRTRALPPLPALARPATAGGRESRRAPVVRPRDGTVTQKMIGP